MKRKVVNPDPVKKKLEQAKEKVKNEDLKQQLKETDFYPRKKIRKK